MINASNQLIVGYGQGQVLDCCRKRNAVSVCLVEMWDVRTKRPACPAVE